MSVAIAAAPHRPPSSDAREPLQVVTAEQLEAEQVVDGLVEVQRMAYGDLHFECAGRKQYGKALITRYNVIAPVNGDPGLRNRCEYIEVIEWPQVYDEQERVSLFVKSIIGQQHRSDLVAGEDVAARLDQMQEEVVMSSLRVRGLI